MQRCQSFKQAGKQRCANVTLWRHLAFSSMLIWITSMRPVSLGEFTITCLEIWDPVVNRPREVGQILFLYVVPNSLTNVPLRRSWQWKKGGNKTSCQTPRGASWAESIISQTLQTFLPPRHAATVINTTTQTSRTSNLPGVVLITGSIVVLVTEIFYNVRLLHAVKTHTWAL